MHWITLLAQAYRCRGLVFERAQLLAKVNLASLMSGAASDTFNASKI